MIAVTVRVTITPSGDTIDAVRDRLRAAPALTAASMAALGATVEELVKREAPGAMPQSIGRTDATFSTTVGSRWRKATLVEKGRRSGKPPPANVLGDRAATTIGRRGSRGTKTFERTRTRARRDGTVARILADTVEQLGALK